MMTTTEQTRDHLTPAERARQRLANAATLDQQKRSDFCSIDPVMMAAIERREAAADLAGSPEAAAIARGHGAPR